MYNYYIVFQLPHQDSNSISFTVGNTVYTSKRKIHSPEEIQEIAEAIAETRDLPQNPIITFIFLLEE